MFENKQNHRVLVFIFYYFDNTKIQSILVLNININHWSLHQYLNILYISVDFVQKYTSKHPRSSNNEQQTYMHTYICTWMHRCRVYAGDHASSSKRNRLRYSSVHCTTRGLENNKRRERPVAYAYSRDSRASQSDIFSRRSRNNRLPLPLLDFHAKTIEHGRRARSNIYFMEL